MKVTTIRLNNEFDVLGICSVFAKRDFNIDAVFGRYVLDAKSIMGMLTLGFGKDIDIFAHTENNLEVTKLFEDLAQWRV